MVRALLKPDPRAPPRPLRTLRAFVPPLPGVTSTDSPAPKDRTRSSSRGSRGHARAPREAERTGLRKESTLAGPLRAPARTGLWRGLLAIVIAGTILALAATPMCRAAPRRRHDGREHLSDVVRHRSEDADEALTREKRPPPKSAISRAPIPAAPQEFRDIPPRNFSHPSPALFHPPPHQTAAPPHHAPAPPECSSGPRIPRAAHAAHASPAPPLNCSIPSAQSTNATQFRRLRLMWPPLDCKCLIASERARGGTGAFGTETHAGGEAGMRAPRGQEPRGEAACPTGPVLNVTTRHDPTARARPAYSVPDPPEITSHSDTNDTSAPTPHAPLLE